MQFSVLRGTPRQVVVEAVTGSVLVDLTGRGWLVVVGTVVVLVDVTGHVWVEVVTGCGVVASAVPTPAMGGRLNGLNASSTLTGYEMLKFSIS